MKTEQFEAIIKTSIHHLESEINITEAVLKQVNQKKKGKKSLTYRTRKYLIVALLFLSCSSIIFAGVMNIRSIDLKNENDEVIGTVDVIPVDKIPHLEVHLDKEEFIRFGDSVSSSEEMHGKSFLSIDTTAPYPYNMDMHVAPVQYDYYEDILNLDLEYILPESFGAFEFLNLSLNGFIEFPEKEVVDKLIAEHPNERFFAVEQSYEEFSWMNYNYYDEKQGLNIDVQIDFDDYLDQFNLYEHEDLAYEIVKIGNIEGILAKDEYAGVTYETDGAVKIKAENLYITKWLEPEKEILVRVKPLMFGFDNIETDEEGNTYYLTIYPENMKSVILDLSEEIHNLLNE